MKILIFVAALAGGVLLLIIALGNVGGFTQISPSSEESGWDATGLAYRQVAASVTNDDGTANHDLTIVGSTRRVLDPWLQVEFRFDRIELHPLLSDRSIDVPPSAKVAWCVGEDGPWQFSDDPLPVLQGVAHQEPSHLQETIFGRLIRLFPDHASRIELLALEFSADARPGGTQK